MIVLDLSILNQKGTPMFNSDLTANRPAAGIVGRIFIAIDSPYGIFRDTGSAWDQISAGGGVNSNIYNSDGTLTGNRVVSSGGFDLSFTSTTFIGSAAIGGGGSGKLIVGSSIADNGIQVFGANSPSIRIDNAQSGGSQRFVFGLATATNNFIQGATAGQFCISTQSVGEMLFGMWNGTNGSEVFRLSTANNLIVGSSVDTGEKVQITGTAKVTSTLSANSFVKSGGTSAQILAADGSVITAGTNITISGGTISSSGGGGGSMAIGGSITGATAGSVLFAGVGGILAQNNANFFWDNTNGRLGIGTATPTRKLEVVGSDAFINTLIFGRGSGNVQSNSVLGFEALNSNTTGNFSVAIGGLSLRSQTGGGNNVAVGYGASQSITTQIHNVSVGYNALNLSTANSNVAIGSEAASSCTTASNIIAIGRSAFKGGTASNNLIIGVQTAELLSGSGANGNTLVGHDLGNASTTMQNSTALGYRAIANTTTGNNNIGIGFQAGQTINSGSNNIFIGVSTYPVLGSDSNRTFIGNDTTVTSWIGGNLLLGSKTDTGQRFQCSGTIRINGQTAATAGGSAGLHLILNLDGTNYKIALLNV